MTQPFFSLMASPKPQTSDEEMFGISGIQSLFHGTPPKNAVDPTMAVFKAVNDFEGDTPRSDDATCLTLFRTEVDS